MEKYLHTLATVASSAPLKGFLAPVIGILVIFAAQDSVAMAKPRQLAYGLSVALYNTAFGLSISIATLFFWHYFNSLTECFTRKLENYTNQLSAVLAKPKKFYHYGH